MRPDEPNPDRMFKADFKQASRVLKKLAERENDVVQFDVKGAKKTTVWKYAPERKCLDRDYSRAQELVGAAIISFLSSKPHQSENAICGAMRRYFGYIDDHCVRTAFKALIADEKVGRKIGPRNANLHSLICVRWSSGITTASRRS